MIEQQNIHAHLGSGGSAMLLVSCMFPFALGQHHDVARKGDGYQHFSNCIAIAYNLMLHNSCTHDLPHMYPLGLWAWGIQVETHAFVTTM